MSDRAGRARRRDCRRGAGGRRPTRSRPPASTRPRLDAELLLAEATGLDRARLARRAARRASSRGGPRGSAPWSAAASPREPVAYILGRKGFRRIELAVDARVLIPRPETELLVEVALELRPGTRARRRHRLGGDRARGRRRAAGVPTVVATDTSLDALAVAQANRERLGLAERVRLEHGTLPARARSTSWSPTCPTSARASGRGCAPEIVRYEPREALVSGPTGLEAIERAARRPGARRAAARRGRARGRRGTGRDRGRARTARGLRAGRDPARPGRDRPRRGRPLMTSFSRMARVVDR